MKRKPNDPHFAELLDPVETRTVALTRVEARAIMDALYHDAIRAAMDGEANGVVIAAGRKIAAMWPAPKRGRKP